MAEATGNVYQRAPGGARGTREHREGEQPQSWGYFPAGRYRSESKSPLGTCLSLGQNEAPLSGRPHDREEYSVTATQDRPAGAGNRTEAVPINKPVRHRSIPLLDLYQTAVGKKWVMAITGIALMGFVFAHMFGNLKMYFGPADYDSYAEALKTIAYPFLPKTMVLWLFRVGLLVFFALHIHSAYSLTRMNHRARPTKYSRRDYIAANFAGRTMRWTGIIVALFLLWHLADLTYGLGNPDFVYGQVYNNVVTTFDRWPVALIYVVANLALGVHLYHGTWSIFQTVGSMNPHFNPMRNPVRRGFAAGFTIVVIGANISFPLAVQFGIVGG